MLENYKDTRGYTVKIFSPNLYPLSLLNTHPTTPPSTTSVTDFFWILLKFIYADLKK